MKKQFIIWQWLLITMGILILLGIGVGSLFRLGQKTADAETQEKHALHVATGNKVSCLNVWSADGGASSSPMTLYYNQQDAGIQAPQIIYLRDENVNTVFCIYYGATLSSGNVIATCSEDAYSRLNDRQKQKISQVMGTASITSAPRDGEGGYNVRNTGSCTFANFQLYNSTQMMIWYCIDAYSSQPGSGSTGGITWEGVVRNCQAGWGNLQECERIRYVLEHADDTLSFCGTTAGTSPVLELKYNTATDAYEGIVTDTAEHLDWFSLSASAGLECVRCDSAGNPKTDGDSLLIRSESVIAKSAPVSLTFTRTLPTGTVWYLVNQSEPQDLAYCAGKAETKVQAWLRVATEDAPKVTIEKTDAADGTFLAGAKLQLYEGDSLLEEWTSGEEAYVTEQLRMGHTYRIREAEAPEGYAEAEDLTFTVTQAETTVTIENHQIVGRVTLRKQAREDGSPLQGAVFQLYYIEETNTEDTETDAAEADDTEDEAASLEKVRSIGTYRTDETGTIVIEELPYGSYYLIEETAPENYQRSEERYFFEIRKDGDEIELVAENEVIPTETTTETTTEVTTEEVTTEEATTEAAEEEYPTAVAAAQMQKQQDTPMTGDGAVPLMILGGAILSGILYAAVSRKNRKQTGK